MASSFGRGHSRKTRPSRAQMSVDLRLRRIAAKLLRFRPGSTVEALVVPRGVARAARDLGLAASLARASLSGERSASDLLVGKLGGAQPLAPNERLERRPLGAQAITLLGMAQAGPIEGLPCRDRTAGDLELLQAAFRIDAQSGYRDGRMTTRAARFMRERHEKLVEFEDRVDHSLGLEPARGTGTARGGPGGIRDSPSGELPPEGGPDEGFVPMYPSDEEGPPIPDGGVPDLPQSFDLCLELSDVCVDLFNGFALASLAQEASQLIASVDPQNLCASVLTEDTEFTASPGEDDFPAQSEQYQLILGDRLIVPARISVWNAREIKFTIPPDSTTGFLRINALVNAPAAGIGSVLANLCGIPAGLSGGAGLSPSPSTILTIVGPPIIDTFEVAGTSDTVVTTEACTAVTLRWVVHITDWAANLPLPEGSDVTVEVRDGAGNVINSASEPTGTFVHNPAQDIAYQLHVESFADSCFRETCSCGEANAGPIEVRRTHLLRVEPREPDAAAIVAGRSGMISVSLSCPAPAGGAVVHLRSSDRSVMLLPETVMVLPGERSAPVQFGTDRDHPGDAVITAELPGHTRGELHYSVLANLTAIVLSGGGAKGSFQAGALLYLGEIWNEIRPTIICGSSVGAINALALAETTTSAGVDKVVQIWLELEYDEQMFVQSEPMQIVANILGIERVDRVVFGEEDIPKSRDACSRADGASLRRRSGRAWCWRRADRHRAGPDGSRHLGREQYRRARRGTRPGVVLPRPPADAGHH